jgi:hypothetical protein
MGAMNMPLTEKSLTNEKRKHPRFNINVPVKYSRTNLFFKYGRATNASEGGMLVYLPEEIETGKDIALKIFFPPRSEINSLELFVQVVWKDIHLRKDWAWDYRTGVKILNISPEDMTNFKNFFMSPSQKTSYIS